MQPTVILTLAAHSVAKGPRRPAGPAAAVPRPVRGKPSRARTILQVVAALAGSLVLVLSLVDPLRGSEPFEAHAAAFEQGVRHG